MPGRTTKAVYLDELWTHLDLAVELDMSSHDLLLLIHRGVGPIPVGVHNSCFMFDDESIVAWELAAAQAQSAVLNASRVDLVAKPPSPDQTHARELRANVPRHRR